MKVLVCGTRKKGYQAKVWNELDKYLLFPQGRLSIIEGCCPDSADQYAEAWAGENNIKLHHFPSTSGNYLKRNIEMIEKADEVIAFWDGFSYGTAHTIAQAVKRRIPVRIIEV